MSVVQNTIKAAFRYTIIQLLNANQPDRTQLLHLFNPGVVTAIIQGLIEGIDEYNLSLDAEEAEQVEYEDLSEGLNLEDYEC